MISAHARQRMQQRGIAAGVLDLLLSYGSIEHDHRGAEIYFLDKAALRRLNYACGRGFVRRLDSVCRCYAVVRDGCVLTTGHRHKHLRRH